MSNLPESTHTSAERPSTDTPSIDATRELAPHEKTLLLEEYKDVGANLRQYINMRFAQLTLFVTITAALLAVIFAKESSISSCQRWALYGFGIFICVIFYAMEYRSTWWWSIYYRRALQLEDLLGLAQYTQRGIRSEDLEKVILRGRNRGLRYFTATYGTLALFIVVVFGWLALAIGSRFACVA